jgi:hypothetical protein
MQDLIATLVNKGSGLDSGQDQRSGPDCDNTLKMTQKRKNQGRFLGLSAPFWGQNEASKIQFDLILWRFYINHMVSLSPNDPNC